MNIVPARFKDGYGPVGAWFLLFKAKAINGYGEDYGTKNKDILKRYGKYGEGVPGTCLRNHLMLNEMREGRGPIYIDTATALQTLAKTMTPKEIKHLEAEAWGLPRHDHRPGRHLGVREHRAREGALRADADRALPARLARGVRGPVGLRPDRHPGRAEGLELGLQPHDHSEGPVHRGRRGGASGHKFSSGSHAEGRIAGKNLVRFVLDNKNWKPELGRTVQELVEEIYRPVKTFLAHKDYTTAIDINPHYVMPKMLQFRLQKIMDEYVGGVSTWYQTNAKMMEVAEKKLTMLKEDAQKMRAKDLHELLRAWENYHRIIAAEAHMRHIKFREETRYPGYYYRTDFPEIDDNNWKVFVNSKYDRNTGEWTFRKVPYVQLVK